MRALPVLGSAAAAAALVVSVPLTAHAATGNIVWTDLLQGTHTISSPTDRECTNFAAYDDLNQARTVTNNTDKLLVLYRGPGCQSNGTLLAPGQTRFAAAPTFQSVFVVP
jgi:hypothetical protein